MQITVMSAASLSDEHVAAWSQIQRENPVLESPYFRPEFTRAVGDVCPQTEVAVLKRSSEIVGFFPFQRSCWKTAKPVGGPMSDFHGLIARRDVRVDAEQLLVACGVRAWHFDHLPVEQELFQDHHCHESGSPFMDLSAGYDAYCAERKAEGSNVVKQVLRKGRKLERECGTLRCELHTDLREPFEKLLGWKSEQYRRTRVPNVFRYPWTVSLLERVLQDRSEAFSGVLSVLYAGDRLAAVDLGMISYGVLHSWFPAYDRSLHRYSPGNVLLLKIAAAASTRGIRRIHLGKGSEAYKRRFMSGEVKLAEGVVDNGTLTRAARRNWIRARQWARRSGLREALPIPTRLLNPLREWIVLRP